jgi:5-methylcytosine-specific restriction protein A
MTRNPNWTREELILALDLYFRVNPLHTSEKHPEIVDLSDLLNKLPIHERDRRQQRFRNPAGVYMKLCNFLRLDPTYEGKGLQAGSRLEEEVWNNFASDRDQLGKVVGAIRRNYRAVDASGSVAERADLNEDDERPEGRLLIRLHKHRERSRALVRRKKALVLERAGCLSCEVCGFDFEEVYGSVGHGVAEAHHNLPLSELAPGQKTKLSDLSIICANWRRRGGRCYFSYLN